MKIAIIGGGVSGLSIGQLLRKDHEVVIYEKCDRAGGLIKCDMVDGSLFHCTGGHVFNTKRQDVMDFFWSFFSKEKEFRNTLRNSVIQINNQIVPYPIENHFYLFNDDIVRSVIQDLLTIRCRKERCDSNFEDFLQNQFGSTLYNLYFKPYNMKVWRRDLTNVSLSWLSGKLPMPSVEEIIYNNIKKIEERSFVHSSFYYPLSGGSQFIANRLAEGLNIHFNRDIKYIKKHNNKWIIDGVMYDVVVFCGNIKQIPNLLKEQIDLSSYIPDIEKLLYHGTTSVFCEIDENDYSWIYLPDSSYYSHRIICSGNFSPYNNAHNRLTATIEFTDFMDKEDIIIQLKLLPFHPCYLAHHYEKYTYPIQDGKTREMIKSLKIELSSHNIYLLGRFAEWEYYNMDVAMGAALDLSTNFNNM